MANPTLNVRQRTVLGKKVAKMRRVGITPANIYGHNVESTAIEADTSELDLLLRRAGRTNLIALALDGEPDPRNVLVRAVSRKATTGRLLHVDFLQVSMREKLTVSVPVVLVGEAPVLDITDGVIFQNLNTVDVECLPGDIPDRVEADLSAMVETSSVIHVRDLRVPPNTTILNDPETAVAGVTHGGPETAAEAEAAEAAATAAAESAAAATAQEEAAAEE